MIRFVVLFLTVLLYKCHQALRARQPTKAYNNIVLVTAHPDDEVMFFAPFAIRNGKSITLVCLSEGGNVPGRCDELRGAAGVLGIRHVICGPYYRDGFEEQWPDVNSKVYEIVAKLENKEWDLIVTFDAHGVSAHPNHHACSDIKGAMKLQSVPLWWKYLGPFSLIMDYYLGGDTTDVYVSDLSEYVLIILAMLRHRSQLVWFRYLYLAFSRYLWINTFSQQ